MAAEQPRRKKGRLRRPLFVMFAVIILPPIGWLAWRYHGPSPAREIFHGVTYGCDRLPDTDQSGGLMHWVRADLNVPGVSLWADPLNPAAGEKGFEYQLAYTSTVVARNNLAAAVNGTLFTANSRFIYMPGDLAVSLETIVSDHQVNHVDQNSYLLWWDDQNIAHLDMKPPSPAALAKAKWAIGSQAPVMIERTNYSGFATDARTAIGADPKKKLVWLVCFDKASDHFMIQALLKLGAKYGAEVDGGTSMSMVLGGNARNVRSGVATGNWRPVATHFGIKADPLP